MKPPWRPLLIVCGLTLALLVAAVAWFASSAGIAATGPHAVASTTDSVEIETGRGLSVEVWFPEEPSGRAPVVLYAHGLGGLRINNRSLMRDLASRGFVSVAADHPGVGLLEANEAARSLGESMRGPSPEQAVQSPEYRALVDQMAAELSATLDVFVARTQERAAGPHERMNLGKVVMIGHSIGGAAAIQACAFDDRCVGVVSLDGRPARAIPPDEPMLAISSALAEHQSEAFASLGPLLEANSGPAYLATLEDAGHLQLTDVPLWLPDLAITRSGPHLIESGDSADVLRTVHDLVIAFLERHVHGRGVPLLDKDEPLPGVSLESR